MKLIIDIPEKMYQNAKEDLLCGSEIIVNAIKNGTPLEQEPKIGHWIRFKDFESGYYHIKCSECGQYWNVDSYAKVFKYCFNCGAKMSEEG